MDIFVLLSNFKNLLLLMLISSLMNLSSNDGKLSVGKHSKLKSAFSLFKLNLFSVFKSKFSSAFEDIFLKIS